MWKNSGWDEDCIRFHFVPIAGHRAAPAYAGICNTPAEPVRLHDRHPLAADVRQLAPRRHQRRACRRLGPVLKFTVDPGTFRRLSVIDDGEILAPTRTDGSPPTRRDRRCTDSLKSAFDPRRLVGLAGCGSDDTIMIDPSKLKPETEDQARQSREYDAKIAEEEGGQSYGGKTPRKNAAASR